MKERYLFKAKRISDGEGIRFLGNIFDNKDLLESEG